MCQSHSGHLTGLWLLPTRPLRLNTNEWINEWMNNNHCHQVTAHLQSDILKKKIIKVITNDDDDDDSNDIIKIDRISNNNNYNKTTTTEAAAAAWFSNCADINAGMAVTLCIFHSQGPLSQITVLWSVLYQRSHSLAQSCEAIITAHADWCWLSSKGTDLSAVSHAECSVAVRKTRAHGLIDAKLPALLLPLPPSHHRNGISYRWHKHTALLFDPPSLARIFSLPVGSWILHTGCLLCLRV